jgi:hypothetical protein
MASFAMTARPAAPVAARATIAPRPVAKTASPFVRVHRRSVLVRAEEVSDTIIILWMLLFLGRGGAVDSVIVGRYPVVRYWDQLSNLGPSAQLCHTLALIYQMKGFHKC